MSEDQRKCPVCGGNIVSEVLGRVDKSELHGDIDNSIDLDSCVDCGLVI